MIQALTLSRGLALALLLGAALRADDGQSLRIKLKHQGPAVPVTPFRCEVPKDVKPGIYWLQVPNHHTPLPKGFVEVMLDAKGRATVAFVRELLADEATEYDLIPDPLGPQRTVEATPSGSVVEFPVRGKPFTAYRTDSGPKPILFPLLDADGTRFTRSFPMEKVEGEATDHPHQRSLWFTYGSVNGIDFWSEAKGHGSIRETSRKLDGSNRLSKTFTTTDDWLDASGKKVLEDERVMTVWETREDRVIDFEVTLKATAGPVEFGDTKEGMFGVRVPSSMDVKAKKGGQIVNAEGLVDGAAWGRRSAWVDYSGPAEDGTTVGITILEHPESFGHPSPWHVRDYGLFAVNPFGRHDFGLSKGPEPTTLEAGKSLTFRYRVILHPGDAEAARPAAMYGVYAHPPKIEISR